MRTVFFLAPLAIAIHAMPVAAQVSLDGPATGIVDYAINMNYVMIDHMARQNMRDALVAQTRGKPPAPGVVNRRPPSANLLAPPSPPPSVAAKEFAARFAPERRAAIERDYQLVMEDYKRIEKRLGFPEDDIAGAMATFVWCSYVAFKQKVDIPLMYAVPVAQQLRSVMPVVPALAQAPPETRRKIYDGFVYSAMKMGGNVRYHLQEHPDSPDKALLQQVARKNLEGFFAMPAERVQLNATGLVLDR